MGQDATEAFYGLHRHEVLLRPQYARLQIGTIIGEKSVIVSKEVGALSKVPYAEPTWLSDGYFSPYYTESHRELQKVIRRVTDEIIYPDAQVRETCQDSFHRIDSAFSSSRLVRRMEKGRVSLYSTSWRKCFSDCQLKSQVLRVFVSMISELNILAMRMGPGKHLKGRRLMNGMIQPEEFNYFHEVWWSIVCMINN